MQTTSDVSSLLSHHARARMQQRSIPLAAVELLLTFADPVPVGGGALSYAFDKGSWSDAVAAGHLPSRSLERFRHAYVIEADDGTIITAAWRH